MVQAQKQGKTTTEIADTLNDVGISDGERKWQPSDIVTWQVARDVMVKKNVPDGVQIALIPRQWQSKDKSYEGKLPVYDKAGKPVMVDGRVKEVPGVSLIPLIRAARDHVGSITPIKDAVKAAVDGKAAVAAIKAVFEKPKPAPSREKLIRAARNKIAAARTPGIDKGDDAKSKAYIAAIKKDIAEIEKDLT